jgi:hypothetical protein
MMEIGGYTTEGLVDGLESQRSKVLKTMQGISSDIKINPTSSEKVSSNSSFLSELVKVVTGKATSINLVVDGKTLASVIAPHQYNTQRSYSRGVGVL